MSLQTRLAELVAAIGADIKALRASNWSEQILTTPYTNSTTTLSDIFAGFTPQASSRYFIDVTMSVASAASTTGVVMGLAGPTSGITFSAVKVVQYLSVSSDRIAHSGINSFTTTVADYSTAPTIATIQAILETGTTGGAGNIRPQARSEIAGSPITVRPGSMMRWRKL